MGERQDDIGEASFRAQVRSLHEHFDKDKDGYLNFSELAALQKATDDATLSEENYLMACRALDCVPNQGIKLEALMLTYAAEGSDLEKDFKKVFGEKDRPNPEEKEEERIYEAGEDGYDIS